MKTVLILISAAILAGCSTLPSPEMAQDVSEIKGAADFDFSDLVGQWDIVKFSGSGIQLSRPTAFDANIGGINFTDDDIIYGVEMGPTAHYAMGCNFGTLYTHYKSGKLLNRPQPEFPEGKLIGFAGIGCDDVGAEKQQAIAKLMTAEPDVTVVAKDRVILSSEDSDVIIERAEKGQRARTPKSISDIAGKWALTDITLSEKGTGTQGWGAQFVFENTQFELSESGVIFRGCTNARFSFQNYDLGRAESTIESYGTCKPAPEFTTASVMSLSAVDAFFYILTGDIRFELNSEDQYAEDENDMQKMYIHQGDSLIRVERPKPVSIN